MHKLSYPDGTEMKLSANERLEDSIIVFKIKQRGVIVTYRMADLGDVEMIYNLEREVWADSGASREQISSRINIFPDGSFLAVKDNEIIGYTAAQRINDLPKTITWDSVTDNGFIAKSHCPDGKFLYGINLSVHYSAAKLGIVHGLMTCFVLKELVWRGIQGIYIGSRMPGFSNYKNKHNNASADYYAFKKNNHGLLIDPELRIYQSHGFEVVRILPDYFPDPSSENFGVLIRKKTHQF